MLVQFATEIGSKEFQDFLRTKGEIWELFPGFGLIETKMDTIADLCSFFESCWSNMKSNNVKFVMSAAADMKDEPAMFLMDIMEGETVHDAKDLKFDDLEKLHKFMRSVEGSYGHPVEFCVSTDDGKTVTIGHVREGSALF